jgi:hypothetical protein
VGVGGTRVGVNVEVLVSEGSGVNEAVLVGVSVWVGTKTVTACSVSAAAVSRLETASSTMLSGWMVSGM